MNDYDKLCEILDYTFNDKALLEQAFTLGFGDYYKGYERLEFLGDRVLGLIISRMLFENFPNENEGDLARRFSDLTKTETLALIAKSLDFHKYVIMEKKIHITKMILCDICEALIGAIYLDAGLEKAQEFVNLHWQKLMKQLELPPVDPKTRLQEWAQGRKRSLPVYTQISRTGPDHNPVFVMQVELKGLRKVRAKGKTKREASQNAALLFLESVINDV